MTHSPSPWRRAGKNSGHIWAPDGDGVVQVAIVGTGPWSVSTATEEHETKARRIVPFPNLGKRTAKELALATVPARATWVVAGMAVCLAISLNAVNAFYPSPRLSVYAHTFEILPIWLLIGGSLHQLGARIVQAWDDWQSWRKS